ncbi:MAG: hypothetical protein NDP13_02240 [Crenarchaeota archaeon]|nr:hypothetical protein [Thermoproteota archaeon]MCR8453793.1 hypothetical protein [Thermoproteota archaeon]MCR8455153.1 hypothetical protein [Thermoproteota archaeon]MCR8462867.1 hypothetical protein [Thermoproteota archaeon]MCR8470977.1 hypothetical protein [Thermoproteota archaeon]
MVTRIELKRSAFISFVGLITSLIIAATIWVSAKQYGVIGSGGWIYYAIITLQLVILWFAFLFSLVLFGCIAEYMNREPGIITIGFSYIPLILYMLALGVLGRFLYVFAASSVFAILYILYSE